MKTSQLLRSFCGAALAIALVASLSEASLVTQQSQLPTDARRTLDQAIKLVEQTFTVGMQEKPIVRRHQLAGMAQSFAQLLDQLPAQLSTGGCEQLKTAEGRDIEAKLTTIACDRAKRPTVYLEIEKTYLRDVHSVKSRFPRSPEVSKTHATEQYRLPWEFFLLTPEPEAVSPLYDFRALAAIGQIRNDASIVTLRFAYRITTLKGAGPKSKVEERQTLILNALNMFANALALRAILDSLSLTLQQPGGPGWDVREYVFRLLTDQEGYDNGEQWKKVIPAFPRSELPSAERELMDSALRALQSPRQ